MATIVGTLKETGKKYYLHGPFYINGEEYWEIPACRKKFKREEFEDGLPRIPRKEFLQELHELFAKYNASIDVSYEETCVLGDPMTTHVYVGDFEVLEIEGSGVLNNIQCAKEYSVCCIGLSITLNMNYFGKSNNYESKIHRSRPR